jgi:hypothetical protein
MAMTAKPLMVRAQVAAMILRMRHWNTREASLTNCPR